jgi:hypothetical protein
MKWLLIILVLLLIGCSNLDSPFVRCFWVDRDTLVTQTDSITDALHEDSTQTCPHPIP